MKSEKNLETLHCPKCGYAVSPKSSIELLAESALSGEISVGITESIRVCRRCGQMCHSDGRPVIIKKIKLSPDNQIAISH